MQSQPTEIQKRRRQRDVKRKRAEVVDGEGGGHRATGIFRPLPYFYRIVARPSNQPVVFISPTNHSTAPIGAQGKNMSIIPASRLSSSDLAILGNNIVPTRRSNRHRTREQAAGRQVMAAIKRSLASVGESVNEFYPRVLPAGGHPGH
jgi:hypothetical protein